MKTGLSEELRAALILFGIASVEGGWVFMNMHRNPSAFFRYLGFFPQLGGRFGGWMAAIITAFVYVIFSARLASVRSNLIRISWLKILSLGVAIGAGILEEVVFRRLLMNYLQDQLALGDAVQVIGSGLAFGLAHGVWGLIGRSFRAAIGATLVTGVLGSALAIVFILSDRVLAPCVVAHFLINALAEPGFVLAALRGEMQKTGLLPGGPRA